MLSLFPFVLVLSMSLALLAVMRLSKLKRYDMIAHQAYNLGEANHNDTKYLITHNLPARAIIT